MRGGSVSPRQQPLAHGGNARRELGIRAGGPDRGGQGRTEAAIGVGRERLEEIVERGFDGSEVPAGRRDDASCARRPPAEAPAEGEQQRREAQQRDPHPIRHAMRQGPCEGRPLLAHEIRRERGGGRALASRSHRHRRRRHQQLAVLGGTQVEVRIVHARQRERADGIRHDEIAEGLGPADAPVGRRHLFVDALEVGAHVRRPGHLRVRPQGGVA